MSVDKYNMRDELLKKDEEYQNSLSMLGRTMIGFPQYNNSTRSNMYTTHQQQFKVQLHPDFPGFFTNGENVVGEHSDGYKRADGEYTVFRKIVKFEGLIENPLVYKLFYFDHKKNRYDVETRKVHENLPEVFGYKIDNSGIDSFEEGDTIPDGTVLWSSTSYDEYMNYGFGKDIPVLYSLDAYTTEDAAVVSDELYDTFQSIESYEARAGINDNDFPLNLYGDKKHYKTFPDIGEYIKKGVLFGVRRKINNQVLHDFKTERLMHPMESDKIFYLEGQVVDLDIYCNNPDFKRNSFNSQIYDYLEAQDKYYAQILECIREIELTGAEVSQEIDYLKKRAKEMLDRDKAWVEKDSSFSNVMLKFAVIKVSKPGPGQKITARFGNKSVIAQVRKKEDMPYYIDRVTGEKKHAMLLLSILSIINRTTGGPIFEMFTNFCSRKIGEEMQLLKTQKERETLLWEYVGMFNPEQRVKMKRVYDKLPKKDKEDYLNYCMFTKILLHQKPAWDIEDPIFYRLSRIADKFPFIQREKIYIDQWDREIECLNPGIIANMYILMLKQTSKKGFSVRGAEAINSKELPERSYKSKKFLEKYSSTAIRFGEHESLNFMIGMMPEELVLFNAFYRTSIEARKDMATAIVNDEPILKMKKTYTSRAAEIFKIIMKSLSYEVEFYNDDDMMEELDNDVMEEHELNGRTFICTQLQFYVLKRATGIIKDVLSEYGVLETEELRDLVIQELENQNVLCGGKDMTKDMILSILDNPESYQPSLYGLKEENITVKDMVKEMDETPEKAQKKVVKRTRKKKEEK